MKAGVTINRPPRDGNMAFVRSPDKHLDRAVAEGRAAAAARALGSMPNTGNGERARMAALLAQ